MVIYNTFRNKLNKSDENVINVTVAFYRWVANHMIRVSLVQRSFHNTSEPHLLQSIQLVLVIWFLNNSQIYKSIRITSFSSFSFECLRNFKSGNISIEIFTMCDNEYGSLYWGEKVKTTDCSYIHSPSLPHLHFIKACQDKYWWNKTIFFPRVYG